MSGCTRRGEGVRAAPGAENPGTTTCYKCTGMEDRRVRQLATTGAALGLAALLWWWTPRAPAPSRPTAPTPEAGSDAPAPPPPDDPAPTAPARHVRSLPPTAADACVPEAEQACHEGDVYWLDSCGDPQELFEDCGERGCEDARCLPPKTAESDCGRTSAYGHCVGRFAEACVQGKLVRIDCATYHERCAMTSEGAACLPFDENGCRGDEPARCEGDRLKLCVDGMYRTLDCSARYARCVERGTIAQCEADAAYWLPRLDPPPQELCDGKDNDDDAKIDEAGACAEVPLVAFIPEGAQLVNLDQRMQQDLEVLNAMFAPTKFQWVRQRPAPASYREFDPKQLGAAASLLSQSESSFARPELRMASGDEAGLEFYVPVLYAQTIKMRPPKAGLSTLPNASCGGVRVSDSPSPVSGLIVLAPSRQPETLAHEMGHYLGLCHTHEQISRLAVYAEGLAECERTGDSICDTPYDPGPPSCFQNELCELTCRDSSRPDALNVMSYYLGCRRALSQEQLAEATRGLSLRRGWFRCQNPLDCPCQPTHRSACPQAMSCRPSGADELAWFCELDGAYLPGTACESSAECSNRAFCAGSAQEDSARCLRPCEDEPECTCADVGLPLQVCREDLGLGP